MRGVAVFLALLLCLYWTWAQGETAGGNRKEDVPFEIEGVKAAQDHSSRHANVTPDIWAELKELRDMAIEQKIEVREQMNTVHIHCLVNLNSEKPKYIYFFQRNFLCYPCSSYTLFNYLEFCCLIREPSFTFSALIFFLTVTSNVFTVLKARLSTSEKQVEELKRESTERPKVAFSLGLTDAGGVGPFNTDITLKFSKVFYNFGEAYNPVSGFFTAPVRGAYYFRFTMWEYRTSYSMTVSLFHNDKRVMWNFDRNDEFYVNMSNALILQLEKGDLVYMTLHSGYSLYDTANNLVTFSGFLLFPL
uniref:C1q domain-containing protein n=1 Tax=Amphiprion percula TaxID=161767 RepID=A0A3P8UD04_AMPPE